METIRHDVIAALVANQMLNEAAFKAPTTVRVLQEMATVNARVELPSFDAPSFG